MSVLNFKTNFESADLSGLKIPVEVRTPTMGLVKRSLVSEAVPDIGPGRYIVTGTLPGGQRLVGQVELAPEDVEKTVQLSVLPGQKSPHETQEQPRYIWGAQESVARVASLGGPAPQPTTTAKLVVYEGNLLRQGEGSTAAGKPDSWLGELPNTGIGGVSVYRRLGQASAVQLIQPGQPPLNVALPAFYSEYCKIVVSRTPQNSYTLSVHLDDAEADSLVRYLEEGQWSQAAELANSAATAAEELLRGKFSNPLGAVVGGYAILRVGELDRLHNWTENLANLLPDFPDAAAIRGEHLARTGQHKEALAFFLRLPSLGLPFMSDGLSYALDRLRLYAYSASGTFSTNDVDEARKQLEDLTRFPSYVDFSRAMLTFTGLRPDRPDAERIDLNIVDATPGWKIEA